MPVQDRSLSARWWSSMGVMVLCACALVVPAGAVASPPAVVCPPGSGAGKCGYVVSSAVDQSSGDLYLEDKSNNRVDEFNQAGVFVRAFGWGVLNGAEELQTCTVTCQAGLQGGGSGEIEPGEPGGLAVDQSTGDLYVTGGFRVQKFSPTGQFLLMFGDGVLDGGANGTGTLSSGSVTVTSVLTTSRAFVVGQSITGVGIPAETRITGLGAGTITLSKPATSSGVAVALAAPTPAANNPVNELQKIIPSGTPTSGTFTLKFKVPDPSPSEKETGAIAYNATAAEVQAALEALSNIGPGNVAVTGAAGGPWTVEFKGIRFADTNVHSLYARSEDFNFLFPGGRQSFLFPGGSQATGGYKNLVSIHGGEVGVVVKGAGARETCTAADLAAGDSCDAGVTSVESGGLSVSGGPVAVDGSGGIWVGDVNRLEHFSSEGVFISEAALPGMGNVESLAVDTDPFSLSFGDVYATTREPVTGAPSSLLKLEPLGGIIESLDVAGRPNTLGLDPATGTLYVSDQPEPSCLCGPTRLLSYSASGVQTSAFGGGQVTGEPRGNALAFSDTAKRLYLATGTSENSVLSFVLPAPGPLQREDSLTAKPRPATATLQAKLTPEGAETHYHFQYIAQKTYEEDGNHFGTGTKETAVQSLPGDFSEHEAAAPATDLTSETVYRFRVFAENPAGEGNVTGTEEATFETLPPVLIQSEAAGDITATSATIQAEVNTLEEPDGYRFEYLTQAAYQENLANNRELFTGATVLPEPEGILAPLEGFQNIALHLQNLASATRYYYRVTVNSPGGVAHGASLTFITQETGGFALPDGRRWELVSPANKYGALIQASFFLSQASQVGDAITYYANAPIEAQPPGNYNSIVQALADRTAAGWQSLNINVPHESAPGHGAPTEYPFFSQDLSVGLLQPAGAFVPSLSAEASEQTPFLRTNFISGDPTHICTSSCYRPLVTGASGFENVPSGTVFGNEGGGGGECLHGSCGPQVVGANLDASRIVLKYQWAPLVEGAPMGSLYGWARGRLSVLSVLPNATLAAGSVLGTGNTVRNAVSSNGSRVAWSAYGGHLYLRDLAREKTVQLDEVQGGSGTGASGPVFQTASSDGSRIFFVDSQRLTRDASGPSDLYECEIVEEAGELKCRLTDLTGGGSESAGVEGEIPGTSEDGAYVYFVASGVLSGAQANDQGETAIAGRPNLYIRHEGVTRLIAVLSGEDTTDWSSEIKGLTARVSPDGHWFSFMSAGSLTGFDNRDAVSGKHDEEVFLYHAGNNGGGSLVCASCDPTGGRPRGISSRGVDGGGLGPAPFEYGQVAAVLPGWTSPFYQSRYLSNSGRLFFDSYDALVPQDTNSAEDAYQFEPAGVGGCSEVSVTFVVASDGCVGLISSGTSKEPSAFLDASTSGGDVFFLTAAQLSPLDTDSALDIYDAHECGAGEDCSPPASTPVPACEGDACQSPVAAPEDPTPGSLTYRGPGNPPVPLLGSKPKSKPKSKTVKCKKGSVERHGKCVRKKRAKGAKKAKRSIRRGK
jgi:hypothetical protein